MFAKWLEEQRLWDLEQVGVWKLDLLDSDLTICGAMLQDPECVSLARLVMLEFWDRYVFANSWQLWCWKLPEIEASNHNRTEQLDVFQDYLDDKIHLEFGT